VTSPHVKDIAGAPYKIKQNKNTETPTVGSHGITKVHREDFCTVVKLKATS